MTRSVPRRSVGYGLSHPLRVTSETLGRGREAPLSQVRQRDNLQHRSDTGAQTTHNESNGSAAPPYAKSGGRSRARTPGGRRRPG